MSAFSEQRAAIRQALISAGLTPDAASGIANILGNSVLAMKHHGPVEIDSTPAGFGYISPEDRKVRFPNLDNTQDDADHRQQLGQDSEERKPNEPEPNVLVGIAPQQAQGVFRTVGGDYIDVAGGGNAAVVGVRNVVAGVPKAGLPLALMSPATNTIVGKAARAQVNNNDGTARLDIQQTDREVLWNLQMLNRADYDVVTGIRFVEGEGLQVKYARIKAWSMANDRVATVPTTDSPVVTGLVEDKNGVRATRKKLAVFGERGMASQYLNTFRIGKFTGGWEIGGTKEVEQVWPEAADTRLVDVENLTTRVADTPSEKYVLFSVRTEDLVPDAPNDNWTGRAEPKEKSPTRFDTNGNPIDQEGSPVAKYYAIEIQPASECVAFSHLDGKLVSELDGFLEDRMQLLIHDSEGCLKWYPDDSCEGTIPATFFDPDASQVEDDLPQVLVNINGCAKWVYPQAYTVVTSVYVDGAAIKYDYDTLYAFPGTGSGATTVAELYDCSEDPPP